MRSPELNANKGVIAVIHSKSTTEHVRICRLWLIFMVSFSLRHSACPDEQACPVGRNVPGSSWTAAANYLCAWITLVARRNDGTEGQSIRLKKAETAALRFQSPGNRHCPHFPSFSTALNSPRLE